MKQILLVGAGWLLAIGSAVAQLPELLPETARLKTDDPQLRASDQTHRE